MCIANERGEIRGFVLCPSKSQSAFTPCLLEMKESLQLYGHPQPHLAFTDNVVTDKPFLTSIFESLQKDVVPISKYGKLERFRLPSNIRVVILDTATKVETILRSIVSGIDPNDSDSAQVVGFDVEWNVKMEVNERGFITSSIPSPETALMQLAWKDYVYLVRVRFIFHLQQTKLR